MTFQNKTQTQGQKRGGFGGRGRGGRGGQGGRGRGRRNFRRNKAEEKAVFDNRVKYPKTVEDFKTYVAPGSLKHYQQTKLEQLLNASVKPVSEKRQLTELKIEECKNYAYYLPHAFPKNDVRDNKRLVHPNDDPKGQFYHYDVGPGGVKSSIEPNSWSDFWKTRRGKRTAYYLQYRNERLKIKARYERMRTTMSENAAQPSYNKVAER